ncbi:MAG: hypothetical protein AB7R90_22225, partial [Reyranellaceae bacterium]
MRHLLLNARLLHPGDGALPRRVGRRRQPGPVAGENRGGLGLSTGSARSARLLLLRRLGAAGCSCEPRLRGCRRRAGALIRTLLELIATGQHGDRAGGDRRRAGRRRSRIGLLLAKRRGLHVAAGFARRAERAGLCATLAFNGAERAGEKIPSVLCGRGLRVGNRRHTLNALRALLLRALLRLRLLTRGLCVALGI